MVEVRSDAGWIPAFRAKYADWWLDAKPLLERHDYAAAFKGYPWPTFTDTPWTPMTKPLAASRVALLTTGGLYRPGMDRPFDAGAPDGDSGCRAIPRDVEIQGLGIAHDHFAHEVAEADMNTIFPLDRLRALVAEGMVGDVAPTHWSLMGYCTRAADLAEQTAPRIASRLRADGVDAALVIPV